MAALHKRLSILRLIDYQVYFCGCILLFIVRVQGSGQLAGTRRVHEVLRQAFQNSLAGDSSR